jgi:hypothetical protein
MDLACMSPSRKKEDSTRVFLLVYRFLHMQR